MRRKRKHITALLKEYAEQLDIRIVKPSAMPKAFAEVMRTQPERVIVGGGDGAMVAGAKALAKTRTNLAVLPLGTTNSFARSLGIPLEIDLALELALKGEVNTVKLGVINGHSFVNVAAFGMTEAIASNISDQTKKTWGSMAYLLEGIRQFKKAKPLKIIIATPKRKYQFMSYHVIISNARFHGRKAVTQTASIDRNNLIILAFGIKGSKFRYLVTLMRYLLGTHVKSANCKIINVSHATIYTDPKCKIAIDGEVISETPAKLKIDEEALRVIC
jgi:diacylglycerol kinase (ATP)